MSGRVVTLTGLPGVRRREVKARYITSVSGAILALRAGFAATSAGTYGAINVWRDDKGIYHGEFHRFMVTQSSESFPRIEAARPWLQTWIARTRAAAK